MTGIRKTRTTSIVLPLRAVSWRPLTYQTSPKLPRSRAPLPTETLSLQRKPREKPLPALVLAHSSSRTEPDLLGPGPYRAGVVAAEKGSISASMFPLRTRSGCGLRVSSQPLAMPPKEESVLVEVPCKATCLDHFCLSLSDLLGFILPEGLFATPASKRPSKGIPVLKRARRPSGCPYSVCVCACICLRACARWQAMDRECRHQVA